MSISSRPSRLVALLSLTFLFLPFITPTASATTSLTCYKGNLVKKVKTKTCPAGYSKTKPVPVSSKVSTYYASSAETKKTFTDPRNSKNIPAAVVEFWKNVNEIAYYVYATQQDELSAQAYYNNAWFLFISKGYQPQAALDSSNATMKGMWFRSDNSPSFITPEAAPCLTPGSSIRYLDYSYTCLDTMVYGLARDITTINPSDLSSLNPISGDGYDPNVTGAPGRRCLTKNASTTLYGIELKCTFMTGTLLPQASQSISIVNDSTRVEYCLLDQRFITSVNPPKYVALALITSSCNSYYKTHTLKNIK